MDAYQTTSFDYFCEHQLLDALREDGDILVDDRTLVPRDISIIPPDETVVSAAAYNRTLTCCINVNWDIGAVDNKQNFTAELFKIPCCIGSKYYPAPPNEGGWYVIKGKERVLVSQLRPAINQPTTFIKEGSVHVEFRTISKTGNSVLFVAREKDGHIFASLPYIKCSLPIGYILQILGATADDIVVLQRYTDHFANVLTDMRQDPSIVSKAVVSGIPADKDITYAHDMIKQEMFYNTDQFVKQICYIVETLLKVVVDKRAISDKESLYKRRVAGPNELLLSIFKNAYKLFKRHIRSKLKGSSATNPATVIQMYDGITQTIIMCFATGNWNVQRTNTFTLTGVSQLLSSYGMQARLSHVRRVVLQSGAKGKKQPGRKLHPSSMFFQCPYETPEGEGAGCTTNLCISVDTSRPSTPNIPDAPDKGPLTFLLNGAIIGQRELHFVNTLHELRNSGQINKDVSIRLNAKEHTIEVWSDGGRLIRPVLYNGNKVYRDFGELEFEHVSLHKTTKGYCEMEPSRTFAGVMASTIPCYNHNQSPRNVYQAAMGKQAIASIRPDLVDTYLARYDCLHYAQKPLCETQVGKELKLAEHPFGLNLIVAIMTLDGHNQEDGVILNKSSVQRGMFVSSSYKTWADDELVTSAVQERFGPVPENIKKENRDYSKLTPDTPFIKKGTRVNKGTVLATKLRTWKVGKLSDASLVYDQDEPGQVDGVLQWKCDNKVHVKFRIQTLRVPECGDKFASRCAQKGTCGALVSQEDMPFDKDGVTPDLIINPHAFPSRMTVNMLIAMGVNLHGCKTGKFEDVSAFSNKNWEQYFKDMPCTSTEMYCGKTGTKYPAKIFMAPAYYQKLKHMVIDKVYARGHGIRNYSTMQPNAGRKKGGGIKIGEMERDGMIAHGVTKIIDQSMYEYSDPYTVYICDSCKSFSHQKTFCTACLGDLVIPTKLPYATKLLFQELIGVGIKIKF